MVERNHFCLLQSLFILAAIALGILTFVIGKNIVSYIWFKVFGLTRALKLRIFHQTPNKADLQKVTPDSKMAALQIPAEERADLKQLIRDQMSEFTRSLQACVKVSLEEECNRNDQRFTKFFAWMDAFKEDFEGARAVIQKHGEIVERWRKLPVTEAATQTERYVLKKKLETGDTSGEHNQPKSIIALIHKDLQEFRDESTSQRNQVMVELKNILSQQSEDKDDLKGTIEAAFTLTSHQAQTSFSQIGDIGRDAMNCIAVLNENTERNLATKIEAIGEKQQKIVESTKILECDVLCVKQTLENIIGQFDEICKKLELGCQKNADIAEEVTNDLQLSKKEWNRKSSQLDEICKQLTCATQGVKDMLANLNQSLAKGNVSLLEPEPNNITDMLTTAKICQVNLESMKEQINQSTRGVQEASDLLFNDLQHLRNVVKNGVLSLKQLTDLHETKKLPGKMIQSQQEEFFDDRFTTLDTISECTEESQFDTESKYSSKIPQLLKTINASLEGASLQGAADKFIMRSKIIY